MERTEHAFPHFVATVPDNSIFEYLSIIRLFLNKLRLGELQSLHMNSYLELTKVHVRLIKVVICPLM